MKIVYCVGDITSHGGIERVLSIKANYFVEQGHDVSIVVIKLGEDKPFFNFDSRIKIYDLKLDFNEHGIKKKINFNRNKKLYIQRLDALFHEIKPDIVISLFGKYPCYIYKTTDGSKKIIELHFAKYKRTPYLAKLDKCFVGRLITYLYRIKEYRIVSHYDAFVVLTEEDKKLWGNLKNIYSIPNPLTFTPKKISKVSHKRIIALGRIGKQKQFDVLLKIWSLIAVQYPDWKLSIFGSGDIEKLKHLSLNLNISSNTEINPITSNVEKELFESSIYALTSKYEGFPMVLHEAMCMGVPPISYACLCGPRDIIHDGEDGFLIEPGDMSSFVEKLRLLMGNYSLREKMGVAASKNIQRYSKDKVMTQWLSLFDYLMIPSQK